MTSLQKRLISGIVLVLLAGGIIYSGPLVSVLFCCTLGIFCIDEISRNFLGLERFKLKYIINLIVFFSPMIFLNFFLKEQATFDIYTWIAFGLNCFLLIYLFFLDFTKMTFDRIRGWFFYLPPLFVSISFSTLTSIFHWENHLWYITTALFLTYGMDVGAYFAGRKFGKHKLYYKVSPNKTVEGLIGGMFSSGILGMCIWYFHIGYFNLIHLFVFMALGVISQMGDLVQSKFKRLADIKDSSNLIPGHGGMYDRLDSLIFVAPFFVLVISLLK